MESVKYLCRIVTGEIIECLSYTKQGDFYLLIGARFSHDVTFGGKEWKPKDEFRVAIRHVVYFIEQDS